MCRRCHFNLFLNPISSVNSKTEKRTRISKNGNTEIRGVTTTYRCHLQIEFEIDFIVQFIHLSLNLVRSFI
ncbi:hypothetical protein Hanom_Chr06g00579221 [Helianthus anomalus]